MVANLTSGLPSKPYGQGGRSVFLPQQQSAQIWQGAMVAEVNGAVVTGTTSGSGAIIGVAAFDQLAPSTGGDGAVRMEVYYDQIFTFNAGLTPPTDATPFGTILYADSDNTVSTAGSFVAGRFAGMNDDGTVRVFVNMNGGAIAATSGPGLSKVTYTINAAVTPLVGSADTNGTANTPINVGSALPASAVILAVEYVLTTQATGGGIATAKLDVGWSGAQTELLDLLDLVGSAVGVYDQNSGTGASAGTLPLQSGGKQVTYTLTPDGSHKLSGITACVATINVYYFLPF